MTQRADSIWSRLRRVTRRESDVEAAGQAARGAGRVPRRTAEAWVGVGAFLLLLFLAWPRVEEPLRFPDSFFYLHWPTALLEPGQPPVASLRPAAYPLTLRLLGSGELLMLAQTFFSLAGFALLGWSLARVPGVIVLGGLSLCSAIAPWNDAVLTESTSLACLAWLFFLSIRIMRIEGVENREGWSGELIRPIGLSWQRQWPTIVLWSLIAVYFVFLRDTNALVLPLLGLCFLRLGKLWLSGAIVFVAFLGITIGLEADGQGRYQVPYATALVTRVWVEPGEFERFRASGMPLPQMPMSAEAREWFHEKGRRMYEAWVLSRSDSYHVFLAELNASAVGAVFMDSYFARGYVPGPAFAVADRLWRMLSLPFGLFLALLALPWVDYRLRGRVGVMAAAAALTVPFTYGVGFVGYHGAGNEEYRHMLIALVLYRMAFLFGAVALVSAVFTRWARGSPASG